MTCYVVQDKGPTRAEYQEWCRMGYTRTWEQYLAPRQRRSSPLFMCGDLGAHCADCADVGEFLCDYPVGDGKTCDRAMCHSHANEVAPEIHYCAAHYREWHAFRDSGGVSAALSNVIAYKAEK